MNEKKIFSSSIAILFNYLLFAYIQRLEKIGCDCGLKTHGQTIKASILLNYFIIIGNLVFGSIPPATRVFIMISDIAFVIYTFIYLYRLKVEKCKCSESIIREVYYYYYALTIFLLFSLLTLSILFILF
jgi:hypothetical protein